jgi:BolA protein
MNRAKRIESALQTITHEWLEIIDESANHRAGAGAESHYKVVVVSGEFADVSLVHRHRRVQELLRAEFAAGLHALTISAFTPDEWRKREMSVPKSPACASKIDSTS